MCFGSFIGFCRLPGGVFLLVGIAERKFGFAFFQVESQVAFVGLSFFIHQIVHINCLPRFEFVVLLVIQFFSADKTGCFAVFLCLAVLLELSAVKQKFHVAFIGVELHVCGKLGSFFGNHPFQIERSAFLQGLFLFFGKLQSLDFVGNFDFIRTQGNEFVGQPVHADDGGDDFTCFSVFQRNDASHIAGLKQVLFVFGRKFVSEKRLVHQRFFAYAVHGNDGSAVFAGLQGQPCFAAGDDRSQIEAYRH